MTIICGKCQAEMVRHKTRSADNKKLASAILNGKPGTIYYCKKCYMDIFIQGVKK